MQKFALRCFQDKKIYVLSIFFLALLLPALSFGHVKWFSGFSFLDEPLSIIEVLNPVYIGLVILSVVVISSLVFADEHIEEVRWYRKVNIWLSDQADYSLNIMRVAMAAVFLISWANGTVLTPELVSGYDLLVWLQFFLALMLLFHKTTMYAGAGLLFLYVMAAFEFGFFHMLDYLHFAGIGIYLFSHRLYNEKLKEIGLPALYITIGFSLIWLGYEKLFYPSWGLYLLEQNPQLALGLPQEFFLQAAAFVEISLGYLLIIGLLERPLAAVITMVFFLTTLVFGKLEVIGHTPIHAALLVFLFNGTGTAYNPPIALHKNMYLRVGFAGVNFLVIAALFLGAYSFSAERQYQMALAGALMENGHETSVMDISGEEHIPEFTSIEIIKITDSSYNLHVELENWEFTPEKTGEETVANEGHIHIYINGIKAGRMYGNWFYLGELDPGEYFITLSLNGNDHTSFVADGEVIRADTTFVAE
ncbi:MAG: DoxX family membrane protein [Balneolaceae bacterium]